jgi:hypothetical protein
MLDLTKVEPFLNKLPIRDRFSRRLVPFHFNPNQKIIHRALCDLQARKRLMRLIVLKARRVGISSYTEGLGICQCLSRDGAKVLIVAHQFKSSKGLFEVPTNLVTRHLPGKESIQTLLDIPAPNKHLITIPHSEGESTLEIATAGSVESGRGLGMSFLHLSEAAFYGGVESFGSLLPTVPRDKSTVVVIESTANGRVGDGGHFYDYWMSAVEGQSEFIPKFIPWMDDPTCVAEAALADDAPADDEERTLVKDFNCSKAQLSWRRLTLDTECKGYLPLFHQEYPSTAEEAFIATGDPVFERDELDYCRKSLKEPVFVGNLARLDDALEFRANRYELDKGHEPIELKVWEMPQFEHKYYIGADAARGMREPGESVDPDELGDFASVVCWNGTTGCQAARVAGRINPEILADWCDRLGRAYNRAMVSIELTGNLGLWAQAVLRDRYRYANLYRWRNRDDKVRPIKAPIALGWETTLRTRPLMMDAFRAAIRERRVTVRDAGLLVQMEACERSDDFRWQVKRGHDDILISALVGWICLEQWAPPRKLGSSSPMKMDDTDNLPKVWRDDVEKAIQEHHSRIMHTITKKPQPDRLEGI